jgi:hypothetical protein
VIPIVFFAVVVAVFLFGLLAFIAWVLKHA